MELKKLKATTSKFATTVLIVPYGIEIIYNSVYCMDSRSINCTLWN